MLFTVKLLVRIMLLVRYRAFCAVLLLVFSGYATAEKRIDLYQDQQLVLDQSETLRKQAATTGLATVIIKATGQKQSLRHPLIQDALARAEAYLYRYSYESTNETISLVGEKRSAIRLLLQFSPGEVQKLLTSAQIPVWLDNRPELLLWVGATSLGTKKILDAESPEVAAFKQAGVKRGLPLSTALLDLTDIEELPAARLWAIDEVTIRQASERYDMDGILAGRVQQSSGTWSGRFLLLYKGGRQYFSGNGDTLASLASSVVSQATAYFATLDAVVVNDKRSAPSMNIVVDNIASFEDYAGLLKSLEDIPVIASALVTFVDGQSIKLQLSYNGSRDKALATLSEAPFMQQIESSNDLTPRFTWR